MRRMVVAKRWGGLERDLPELADAPRAVAMPPGDVEVDTFDIDDLYRAISELPPLEPGESLSVTVRFQREYEDTPGKRMFERMLSSGLLDSDVRYNGWAGLSRAQRGEFELLAREKEPR